MEHIISLAAVPIWARFELAKEIKNKIENEKIAAKIPHLDNNTLIHNDFPVDIYIKGASVVLVALLPFIHHWLSSRKVNCEIKDDGGVTVITVSGSDPKRVIKVKKMLFSENDND